MLKDKFYVTTPIYYVTAKPHLGSLYSTLLADVASRYNKLKGKNTFMLTGTDEHGQKIEQAAKKINKDAKSFVDSFVPAYKTTWNNYDIEYDKFIRTTDEAHIKAVQKWLQDLIDKGDIYKGFYEGWYCVPCETFVADKSSVKSMPLCPNCNRDTNIISEDSYFFRLSKYQDKLLKFYEDNPDFITPKERLSEVISFVKSGLKDLSISRSSVKWGIPFPGDDKHVTYVWADALSNYITAIGYGFDAQKFNFWWPADLQILGKDIVRFHAVYWPAFLMATDLALPNKLLVHGWIKVDEQKMSKSLGNAVDPEDLLENYQSDLIRYYLIRHIATTQDSEFSIQALRKSINNELANDLGNLLNRIVSLSFKYNINEVLPTENLSSQAIELKSLFLDMLEVFNYEMENGYFYRAYDALWKYINNLNSYFHKQEPWKVVRKDIEEFKNIISTTLHGLYRVAILLWPVMPNKSTDILHSLGISLEVDIKNNIIDKLKTESWNKTFKLTKIPALFEKYDIKEKLESNNINNNNDKKDNHNIVADNIITIDDVAKVQLRVGTILECEDIKKSNKLYKLLVDFGELGKRQILAGIKKYYTQEELINKQSVFVYNLKPIKIMGLESYGMLLLAKDSENNTSMATVCNVLNGTRLS